MTENEKKKPKSYRDLLIWHKGMELVCESYRLTKNLPKEELFGLTSQIRRAAISVPANIAEGFGRWHPKDYARHLRIAAGSLSELETHLLIASPLDYLKDSEIAEALKKSDELGRMMSSLLKKLDVNGA